MLVHSIIEGNYSSKTAEVIAATQSLKRFCDDYNIEGFVKVIAARQTLDGLTQMYEHTHKLIQQQLPCRTCVTVSHCITLCYVVQDSECRARRDEAQHSATVLAGQLAQERGLETLHRCDRQSGRSQFSLHVCTSVCFCVFASEFESECLFVCLQSAFGQPRRRSWLCWF